MQQQNPYRGINAHFNSYLQTHAESGWRTFHNHHITYITDALNEVLPETYYALAEKSLYIQLEDDTHKGYRPDVSVQRIERASPTPSTSASGVPTLSVDAFTVAMPNHALNAVRIYQHDSDSDNSHLVTHIELLSPTNKRQPAVYYAMRYQLLSLGIHLVDIDYLHQQPTLYIDALPTYPQDGYPYVIAVNQADTKQTDFYCFHVDSSIPDIPIPLTKQSVTLDFDAIYQAHFKRERRAHVILDYTVLPKHFESYATNDQFRIRAVMERL